MKLKSDRELDRWIAENLYNWKLIPQGAQMRSGWITAEYWLLPDGTTSSACNGPKNYTSDMNEAVEILSLIQCYLEPDGHDWLCNSYYALFSDPVSSATTPAMAICLAAYKLETGKDWGCNEK